MDEGLRRLITLGREHYRARDYVNAERCLAEVVRHHRGFADVFNMLGVIYHDQGNLPQAQEAFEEALRINPTYTEAALNLSVTYNDLGKYTQAREVYTHAIMRSRAEPRSLDLSVRGKLANMHAELGAAYASNGLYAEAIREYQKSLDLCPKFVDLRTRLAGVYRDRGDHATAALELEAVKAANPSYLPARLTLGTVLLALGRREDALREWQAVLELDPQNKRARVFLQMVQAGPRPRAAGSSGPLDEGHDVFAAMLDGLDGDED